MTREESRKKVSQKSKISPQRGLALFAMVVAVATLLMMLGALAVFALPNMGNTVKCAGDCTQIMTTMAQFTRWSVFLIVVSVVLWTLYRGSTGDPNAE